MLLRVALIGPLICAINSARYLRTLSILQSSGVPLLDGWDELSTESLSNLEIPPASAQMRQKRSAG